MANRILGVSKAPFFVSMYGKGRTASPGGGGLPYLISTNYADLVTARATALAAGKRLYVVGHYDEDATLAEGEDLFGDDYNSSVIHGWVKTAPNVNLTDLKVGVEGGTNGTNAFGRTATHSMLCTRVTFTGGPVSGYTCGVIAYSNVDAYDMEFVDCIIEGDPTNYIREGVSFTNYGQAGKLMHDVRFIRTLFKSGGACGANVIGYHDEAGPAYDHPFQYFDFIDCTFEPMGAQGITTACWWPQRDGVGEGLYTNGYGTISGCHFQDCGAYADTDQGKHGIEMYGVRNMNILNNHFYGPDQHTFLSIEQYGEPHALPYFDSQILVEGNEFDGTLSATSSLNLKGRGATLRNNIIRLAYHATMNRTRDYLFDGNHLYSVGDADYLFYTGNSDVVSWINNDFHSGYVNGFGTLQSADGYPTTNWVFGTAGHGNTYDYTGGGSRYVRRGAGSTDSGIDLTTYPGKFE